MSSLLVHLQDQAMSPVLQQYIMQQKHQQAAAVPAAIPRAPAKAPDSNRPRMSNAMARHLGIIPGKDQRQRMAGEPCLRCGLLQHRGVMIWRFPSRFLFPSGESVLHA